MGSSGKVGPDPEKIKAIRAWPKPRSLKALRGFLGLSGFYPELCEIASSLTTLLKKDVFVWSSTAQVAMDSLKEAIVSAPVLALPNFSHPFVVQTDASNFALGTMLLQ